VLFKIYEVAQSASTDRGFLISEIHAISKELSGPAFVTKAVHDLLNKSLLTYVGDDPEEQYELSVGGIRYIETALEDPSSTISRFNMNETTFLTDGAPQTNVSADRKNEPSYSDFRDRFLLALARKEEADGPRIFDLKQIADDSGLAYRPGWVRKAATQFKNNGWVLAAFTIGGGEDGGLHAQLTGNGLEAAERLTSVMSPRGRVQEVPAADRIVPLDHNSPEYREAVNALEEVAEAVRSNNEYANEDPEDRNQRLVELEAAEKLLEAPRVSESAIKIFAIRTLRYLGDKFADHAIGLLAGAAITALLALLQKAL
jgi:hypothetical protein